MSYTAHVDYAFDAVERIMRDVNLGWMIRYIHMNAASFFFIVVYIHIFRGLYYGSYKAPRELLWILGVVIFLLMMATAFMGYVLPWGQMSFWGATVITNLFSAIPVVGDSIVTLLWGGFSVIATLNRFFSLHYLMPFVIAGVVVAHYRIASRSNKLIGIDASGHRHHFIYPFTMKDLVGIAVFLLLLAIAVFLSKRYGTSGHYIPATLCKHQRTLCLNGTFHLRHFAGSSRQAWRCFANVWGDRRAVWLPWLDRSPIRSARFRPCFGSSFGFCWLMLCTWISWR